MFSGVGARELLNALQCTGRPHREEGPRPGGCEELIQGPSLRPVHLPHVYSNP